MAPEFLIEKNVPLYPVARDDTIIPADPVAETKAE